MTYTPGPWIVFRAEDGARLGVDAEALGFSVVIYGTNDDESGIYGRDAPEAVGNARLIAAAPDLLAALKYLLELGGDDDRRIAAEAAIAKAEGR